MWRGVVSCQAPRHGFSTDDEWGFLLTYKHSNSRSSNGLCSSCLLMFWLCFDYCTVCPALEATDNLESNEFSKCYLSIFSEQTNLSDTVTSTLTNKGATPYLNRKDVLEVESPSKPSSTLWQVKLSLLHRQLMHVLLLCMKQLGNAAHVLTFCRKKFECTHSDHSRTDKIQVWKDADGTQRVTGVLCDKLWFLRTSQVKC